MRYRYEISQKVDISKFSSIEQGNHSYKLMVLEVLLAQTEITGETDELQEKKVLRTALETTFKKKEDADVHGDYGLVSTIWLMSRILDRAGNEEVRKIKSEDSNFETFLADGNMVINYSISEKIINLSQKHLSQ